jgi:hypothetical protein
MEQIIIAYKAYKRILEAARLLAAANERVLADEARALAEKLAPRNAQYGLSPIGGVGFGRRPFCIKPDDRAKIPTHGPLNRYQAD